MSETTSRPRWVIAAALIAVVFGVVTVFVGGKTLFGPPAERAAAGNIVPFVLFEIRTIGAMTIRSLAWIAIAIGVCRALECFPRPTNR